MILNDILTRIHENTDKKNKGVVLKLYLENFKRLNIIFGYEYCEKLLDQIIAYLTEATGNPIYRHVGVEFIAVLEQATQGEASEIAEEITERFESVWKVDDTDCLCSIQVGMCTYPGYSSDAGDMMKCLDLALTRAGEMGPNQYLMYDSTLRQETLRRQTIAHYLHTALENEEIEVRFRPTYHIEEERFTRAEFYMRIFIQGLGMIGAGEFLPIAEDSGQVRMLEYFALEQVGKTIAALIEDGVEFESIALPISSVLFLQEDFLENVENLIGKYKIPKKKLAIEVEESVFLTAQLNMNVVMQELSDMGIELILNNFGSGYSGITSILDLPIDTVKLERMFIWQLETNPDSAHIIEGLIQIAKNLNIRLIAEGVETENQLRLLNAFDCPLQQGFYYSPTMELASLKQVLNHSLKEAREILVAEKLQAKK